MMTKSTFQGKFMYYENINGKEKKVEKSFTDPKKFSEFVKKHPIKPLPTLGSMLGLTQAPKKAPAKKVVKKAISKKK